MAVKLYVEPELNKPDLIASWPGIGNVGLIAADTLRSQLDAEGLGEIEPWDFFYPRKVRIKAGVLEELEFPGNKFYFKRLEHRDLMFFIGEEQPAGGSSVYAEGHKAYRMASMVMDVAQKFGCRRVYTSGAAVSLTHHALKPRVWTVATGNSLLQEVKSHENTVLMNDNESTGEHGSITGLNGLLLGLAKKRGLEAVCLMGEIPDYLSGAPFPYPQASRSVLEVITAMLGVKIDFTVLDDMTTRMNDIIEDIYEKLPPEIRERVEHRKQSAQTKAEAITEEDKKWIGEHIDELFRKGGKGDGQPT